MDIVSVPKDLIKQALSNVCSVVSDNDASPIYNCMRIFTDRNIVEVTAVDVTDKRTFVHIKDRRKTSNWLIYRIYVVFYRTMRCIRSNSKLACFQLHSYKAA